jgi:thiol:disulfide interchange protein DsbA
MKFARRSFVSTIFALGAALTVARPSLAQTAGKDYTPISPAQPTDDAAKVEVLEFFSYGCPHCADFNPLVTAWAAKLPADVVFKKVPITFGRGAWESIAGCITRWKSPAIWLVWKPMFSGPSTPRKSICSRPVL